MVVAEQVAERGERPAPRPETGSVEIALWAMSRLYSPWYLNRSTVVTPVMLLDSHGRSRAREVDRTHDRRGVEQRIHVLDLLDLEAEPFEDGDHQVPAEVQVGSKADVTKCVTLRMVRWGAYSESSRSMTQMFWTPSASHVNATRLPSRDQAGPE